MPSRLIRLFLALALAGAAARAQTAVYPGAVVSDSQLRVAVNNVGTTLAFPMLSTDTTINAANGTGIVSNSIVTIDNENIAICAVSGNQLTVGKSACPNADGRGFDGTAAAAHASGAAVQLNIDAWHHNALKAEVEAVETALGANLGNVPASVSVAAKSFNFTAQTPGGSLAIGSNTITLTPCPMGVNGSDPSHSLYITGGTGSAEAAPITGGTCTSGATSGTVIVTAANTHSGAWTVGPASGGLAEAICSLPSAGGAAVVSSAITLLANVSACGKTDVMVTKLAGAAVSGAFTILGSSLASVSGQATVSNLAMPLASAAGVPAYVADIRSFGGVCNGSNQNTAVQAAISAGALIIYIPGGCLWTPPSNTIPGGLTFIGQNGASIIAAATPSSQSLTVGPLAGLRDFTWQSQNCVDGYSGSYYSPGCRVDYVFNASAATGQMFLANPFEHVIWLGSDYSTQQRGVFSNVYANESDGSFWEVECSVSGGSGCRALRIWVTATVPGSDGIGIDVFSPSETAYNAFPHASGDIGFDVFNNLTTSGNMFEGDHNSTAFNGTFLAANFANGSGSFGGYFENYLVNSVAKWSIDSGGNATSAALITAAGLEGGNLTFSATGAHVKTNAAQSDIGGVVTISSSTSGSQSFTTGFGSTPACALTPLSDVGSGVRFWATSSTSAVTAHLSSSGSVSFVYHCFGNPN